MFYFKRNKWYHGISSTGIFSNKLGIKYIKEKNPGKKEGHKK